MSNVTRVTDRASLCVTAGICAVVALVTVSRAGPIFPSQAALTARVQSALSGEAIGLTGDLKTANDVGTVAKPSASASAEASADNGAGGTSSAPGTADTAFAAAGDGFTLTGSTTASLAAASPFEGHVDAVTNAALTFDIDTTSVGKINYDITIDDMVSGNAKVTLILDRLESSAEKELFRTVFTDTTTGSMPDLASGRYRLIAVTGTETTTKGVAGETEATRLSLSMSREDAAVNVIPLPSPLLTGAAALAFAGLLARRARWAGLG
jgi:hypothetical protein